MRPRDDPSSWHIPAWHPDWDGDFTFAALRAFAESVLTHTDLETSLAIVEDGYAHLDVFRGSDRVGIVHVNRGDGGTPKYSVYAGAADELHTSDVPLAIQLLRDSRTAFPADAV
jgi:hypothetical protein